MLGRRRVETAGEAEEAGHVGDEVASHAMW